MSKYFTLIPPLSLDDLRLGPAGSGPFEWNNAAVLFSYGRSALLGGIRLLGNQYPGKKEVMVPAYMCEEALWPLREAGFHIKYYSINDKFSPSLAEIKDKTTSQTLSIMAVHYFGIPQDLSGLKQLCREKGIYLIEDCAHALNAREQGRPLGATGDMAIFSLRKFLPIPDGGALIVNNKDLMDGALELKTVPNNKRSDSLKRIGRAIAAQYAGILYKRVSGQIKGDKIEDICPRADIEKEKKNYISNEAISDWSRNICRKYDYGKMSDIRRNNYNILAEMLADLPFVILPSRSAQDGWSPYVLPVYVPKNRQYEIVKKLQANGIGATDWPTLPPDLSGAEKENAYAIMRKIVLLPIHQNMDKNAILAIGQVIRQAGLGI